MAKAGLYRFDRFEDGAKVEGASGAWPCSVEGIAKGDADTAHHRVAANEMLATRLGQALGLPVPPGALVDAPEALDNDGRSWFVSLRLSSEGEFPPAVVASDLYAAHPEIVAGIYAFDAWIWNPDRNAKNLGWLPGRSPVIWDHAPAFGGESRPVSNLHPIDSVPPRDRSCLTRAFDSAEALERWASKIDHYASGPLMAAAFDPIVEAKLLRKLEVKMIAKWLVGRSRALPAILREMLPELPDWGLS